MPKRRRRGAPPAQYWVRAAEKAKILGEDVAQEIVSAWDRAKPILERSLNVLLAVRRHPLELARGSRAWALVEVFSRERALGVDSSRTPRIRLGFRHVSFVSASLVSVAPSPGAIRGNIEEITVDPWKYPEKGQDPGAAERALQLRMFEAETSMLERALEEEAGVLMLDGPLVDPPGLVSSLRGTPTGEEARGYACRRARALARLAGAGVVVVGYVKRLLGRTYIDSARLAGGRLGEVVGELDEAVEGVFNDSFLATSLGRAAREYYVEEAGRDRWLLVSRPVELSPEKAPDAPEYLECMREEGGDWGIYTSLYLPGASMGNTRRPARIEFLAPRGGDPLEAAARAAAAAEALLAPGAWIPAPVLLAHRACTIRSREARKMLRELLASYARASLDLSVAWMAEILV